MIAGLTKGDKAAEAGDQFEKHFCIGPTLLNPSYGLKTDKKGAEDRKKG